MQGEEGRWNKIFLSHSSIYRSKWCRLVLTTRPALTFPGLWPGVLLPFYSYKSNAEFIMAPKLLSEPVVNIKATNS